jgi:hypothetical protein
VHKRHRSALVISQEAVVSVALVYAPNLLVWGGHSCPPLSTTNPWISNTTILAEALCLQDGPEARPKGREGALEFDQAAKV